MGMISSIFDITPAVFESDAGGLVNERHAPSENPVTNKTTTTFPRISNPSVPMRESPLAGILSINFVPFVQIKHHPADSYNPQQSLPRVCNRALVTSCLMARQTA
jgi:hypothetical protein